MTKLVLMALFALVASVSATTHASATPAPQLVSSGVPAEHYLPTATGPDCFALIYTNPCETSSTGCLGGHNACHSPVQLLVKYADQYVFITVNAGDDCAAGYCEQETAASVGPMPMVAVMACLEDDKACETRMGDISEGKP